MTIISQNGQVWILAQNLTFVTFYCDLDLDQGHVQHEVFMPLCTSVILPNINFLRIILTKPWAFRSFFSDCQISHDLWPLTSISAMLHPPKPTNGAQIPIREVFLHKNQWSNLLYPSDPLDFLILAFWPCGSPTIWGVLKSHVKFWKQSCCVSPSVRKLFCHLSIVRNSSVPCH